ncbi:MAG: hypothetical protein GXP55_24230 [Deltaproteobacteria bacterium]|nr:hypothetical protein [Deltaproteobacteria bacterium]
MLKYALYALFGLTVVGGYAAFAALSGPGRVYGERGAPIQVPPSTNAETYRTAPVIWRTGFHGPAARVIDYTPRRRTYGGSGYGGSGRGYGGYGGK